MRVRVALALLLVAGCGGGEASFEAATPRTMELGWREVGGPPGPRVVFSVRRLVLSAHGWRADVGFRNESADTLILDRTHRLKGSMLGRVVASPSNPILIASRVEPPPPRVIRAGSGWSGTMTGFRPLPRGALIRVAFGRFVSYSLRAAGGRASRLYFVTDRAVRL